jgi:hypothetical protein
MVETPKCRFLGLPPEIRNIIYHYVLIEPGALHFIQLPTGTKLLEPRVWLSLLFACRQVYTEATKILYGEARFRLISLDSQHQLETVRWFLDMIGPENAHCIRELELRAPDLCYVSRGTAVDENNHNIDNGNNDNSVDDIDNADDGNNAGEPIDPEVLDPENFDVGISEAGMESLRLLHQRCPGIRCIKLFTEPPILTPSHHLHCQHSDVVQSKNEAPRLVMRELMKFPSLGRIFHIDVLKSVPGVRAAKSFCLKVRSSGGWEEGALCSEPGSP